MSRPRTPTVLKLLKGTTQAPCRTNKNEPIPRESMPRPPSIVTGLALVEWRRVMPELTALGIISVLDRAALAAYCVAYGRWIESEKVVAEHGFMLKAPNNLPMPSPYLSVANKAMEQMIKAMNEFGMTPAGRSKVSGTKKKPDAEPAGKEKYFK